MNRREKKYIIKRLEAEKVQQINAYMPVPITTFIAGPAIITTTINLITGTGIEPGMTDNIFLD
ncbi:MAG: hypothetical protein M3015_12835 [Bacteroidota bacterium]|nr:hypothetical protein [Bacteroidota bacterium]